MSKISIAIGRINEEIQSLRLEEIKARNDIGATVTQLQNVRNSGTTSTTAVTSLKERLREAESRREIHEAERQQLEWVLYLLK